ncbi:hypothetical protein CAPTEDRAFT_117101 [Capitella teleta]|uniref:Cholesterol side-chain cleavage enzyme, mitochondrial n=1 Tax=Capitella teleta TaxID=283909 RepID=R7UDX1_CAPTE|nr:hypothetical protein CAPTEDRAFT_117101 [Capitella teleta]|eukprot:ELU04306.1 hypothetical protein CAPTEDRAFT_117101 [Capitella teleta]
MKYAHWYTYDAFKKYGSVFHIKFPALNMIWLNDVPAIERLLRLDGKYPARIMVQSWKEWRELNDKELGVLTVNGPTWKRQRRVLDKKMLRPNQVKLYTDNFNLVVTDFVDRLKYLRNKNQDGVIEKIDVELFNWSLEMIGTVLYETRFGGLQDSRSEEMQKFIRAVESIFRTTGTLFMLPRKLNKVFAYSNLKEHDEAWKTIFTTGKKYIDKKVMEIDEKIEKGEEIDGFLANLVLHKDMSRGEIYSSTAELMMAAVDTTSNTMQWVIEMLARNPDIQKKLHQEVSSVVGKDQVLSNSDIQNLPYLKAIIKEVLRMYPVAGTITRILSEETAIQGYLVPADTTVLVGVFQICRDPDIFPEPNVFKPERWLRDDSDVKKRIHNFAWLPFGFGTRMCLGRRVAELELQLLTARLSQMFEIHPADEKPLEVVQIGLLKPDRPVSVKLVDRN